MPESIQYAHTREDAGPEHWQTMAEHLDGVARLAGEHAAAFGSRAWGDLAGRWHDLGKYAGDFQDYLRASSSDAQVLDASVLDVPATSRGRVDHSTAGAALILEKCAARLQGKGRDELPATAAALSMVIAGHHGGLPARLGYEKERLAPEAKQARLLAAKAGGAPADLLGIELPTPPDFLRPESIGEPSSDPTEQKRQKRLFRLRHEFWTRMLFSALVDADSLDTEAFCNGDRARQRGSAKGDAGLLNRMRAGLDQHLLDVAEAKREQAARTRGEARSRAEAVLRLRADVLTACREAAKRDPGRHSLTVPTGGGKTLSALAFALDHAILHGLRRVIVVIPFTTIIDQTAGVYRKGFGRELSGYLVEHHSNLDPKKETYHNRLASENWDAPVIVTTSVQFFESLFSRKRSPARKLHNIARSVVVLDEVQTLPHELRGPIFDVLNELTDRYGVSALFCTATQPALSLDQVGRLAFPHLPGVQEVMSNVPAAFAAVKDRVVADFPVDASRTTWEALAEAVRSHDRVLAIVHLRYDARSLCELVGPGTVHLSTLMCAAHRRAVVGEVRRALADGSPVRVVSTTLIEAGVDLDFPVAYRALGGADAMAQAAGRCNREGRLADADGNPIAGRLFLFRAPSDPPPGLGMGKQVAETMLRAEGTLDLFDPSTYDRYFREYFAHIEVVGNLVTPLREALDFPAVEAAFRMIDDGGKTDVVVPYEDAALRVEDYRRDPGRRTLRALQPFVVSIPERQRAALSKEGLIDTIHDQVQWLSATGPQYDPRFGLIVDRVVPIDPGDLIDGLP